MTRDANDIVRDRGVEGLRKVWDAAEATRQTENQFESFLVARCAADVKPEKVNWLWPGRLPLGKCVLVAGEGGLGKSLLLARIAAIVSQGHRWPCDEGRSSRGSILIFSAEDDVADTIVPRLMAADADLSNVHIVSAVRQQDDQCNRTFNLQLDLPKLESKIGEVGDVLLVIIDPITSYLGKVDSHRNAELRSVLEPLGEMAARLGVTVIANTHMSKAASGSANSRVIGSVAFVNHARAAFIVVADPEDKNRRLFIPSKANLGRPKEGIAYRIADRVITGTEGELISAPYVDWEDSTVNVTADEAITASASGAQSSGARDEAKEFLLEMLAEGPVTQKEIKKAAESAGLAWRTVQRAKAELGIKARPEGAREGRHWKWSLPTVTNSTKSATQDDGSLGTVETSDDSKDAKDAEDATSERGALDCLDGVDDFPELPAFLDRRARVKSRQPDESSIDA